MTKTPLSDLISLVLRDRSQNAMSRFHEGFLVASVGVEVEGLPPTGQLGQRIDASGSKIRSVETPDGRVMVRASADPDEFVRNYPDRRITGLMTGAEILAMLLKIPQLDGVLVCSATSFHSIPIDRTEAARLLDRARQS